MSCDAMSCDAMKCDAIEGEPIDGEPGDDQHDEEEQDEGLDAPLEVGEVRALRRLADHGRGDVARLDLGALLRHGDRQVAAAAEKEEGPESANHVSTSTASLDFGTAAAIALAVVRL
mgnify:CR=1 FL=1